MKLRGLIPNFHIRESVSDFYIHTIGPPILLSFVSGNICFEFSVCSAYCMYIAATPHYDNFCDYFSADGNYEVTIMTKVG